VEFGEHLQIGIAEQNIEGEEYTDLPNPGKIDSGGCQDWLPQQTRTWE